MNLRDKVLLRKRVIMETVNDQLKNISQIEHTRQKIS
jgi:Transposase DDE domain